MYSKNIRYFTALLLVCFMFGFIVSLFPVSAISPFDEEAETLQLEDRIKLYLDAENAFKSAEEKLLTMKEKITRGDYTMYVDELTAEVAVKNNKTGQILATNPYDVATTAAEPTKMQLMSQVVIEFVDLRSSGQTKTFYSYEQAASRGQIEIKNIKNGIRVEYTLGKQSARRLLPRWMEKTRFETLIFDAINEGNTTHAKRLRSYYAEINPNKYEVGSSVRKKYNTDYPCTKDPAMGEYGENLAIYVIDKNIVERQENEIEGYIKQHCPHYNFEELEYDHEITKYEGADKSPAIFRMAVEYYLSAEGLTVTVPANSIRFDEDNYRLNSVTVLPYFGASSNDYTGYTFVPDGSGTIIRNEEIMMSGESSYTLSGQIYGADFAYHELTGFNGKSEVMRLPVFGVVEDTVRIMHNLEKHMGYTWETTPVTKVDETTGEEVPEFYTETDRIMIDAIDNKGSLILSEAEFWSQFRYMLNDDGTYTVIKKGDKEWDAAGFSDIDSVEMYAILEELKLVPYYEKVEYYLMAPLVLTKKYTDEEIFAFEFYGTPYTTDDYERKLLPITMIARSDLGTYEEAFDYVTYNGDRVYVYVNEVGEKVEEADRIEGVFKIREQLFYNGEPAYYNTNVPVNPEPEEPETPETPEGETPEGETPEGETPEGETPEGETPEGETPEGETPEGDGEGEGEGEGEEEEPEVDTTEYYNDIQKTVESYDTPAYEEYESIISQGFVAILTDGDALARITSTHGAKDPDVDTSVGLHKYNSVSATFYPRPQDSYRLADAISVGSTQAFTVVSERKYTGNYTLKYVMITDATYTDENEKEVSYEYEASYVGMANAYRDYLIEQGILTKLSDIEDDIPLYLEFLGVTEVKDTILTIPVMLDTALTSFDDIKEIYEKFSTEEKIDNIRARLTGFTKNGMDPLAPSGVKFERVVGGNKGYVNMVEYCESVTSRENGTSLKIFPDFDFANLSSTGLFDGVSYFNDTIRTMDDRYTGKRTYSATYQSFQRMGSVCVSPAAYEKIYNKFSAKINKLAVSGLSFSTLGTDLNSDFNEDNPYNRDDTKDLTIALLESIYKDYGKFMIDGGNAYAIPYASDILYMSLDSSRFASTGAAVPFMGIVLHGYVNYAGDPTNTAGDIYYETLKIIENGASPFFILAYQHTEAIKEDNDLSQYYAVDYEIWYKDIVSLYNKLNDALGDVQSAVISDHEFLDAERALTEEETAKAASIFEEALAGFEEALADAQKEYNDRKILAERHGEDFEEVFEETYEYLKDAETYAEYMRDKYVDSINKSIAKSSIVSVTYTREDGTSKTFILNYNSQEINVTFENDIENEDDDVTYSVAPLGFVVIEK